MALNYTVEYPKLQKRITELKAKLAETKNFCYMEIPALCSKYESRISQLENLIADLQCTGVYCGLDGCLCDNCRIRLEALHSMI
jgi:hypothetical protein